MATVKVKFFGVVRELTHTPNAEVELAANATFMDLLEELHKKYGKPFSDNVLCQTYGVQNHVKLFMNDEEVDRRQLKTTRIAENNGGAAEALIYVIPTIAGG